MPFKKLRTAFKDTDKADPHEYLKGKLEEFEREVKEAREEAWEMESEQRGRRRRRGCLGYYHDISYNIACFGMLSRYHDIL